MSSLLAYARRALEMPPRQALRAAWALAAARGSALRQRAVATLGPDPMDDAAFGRLVGRAAGPPHDGDATIFFGSSEGVLPLRWNRPAELPDSTSIRAAAADAIAHRFDLLGSGPVRVTYELEARGVEGVLHRMAPGPEAAARQRERMEALLPGAAADAYEPIDWHVDFKSGYRWSPRRWFSGIRYGMPGVDVKVPWELSRFQHLGALGLVHRLEPDTAEGRRAAAELRAQIVDWIAANPVGRGVNWSCTMDVGLRAVSWLVGLALVDGAPEITPHFRWLVAKSLNAHGRHIEANLEYHRESTGNHYLSNVVGLLCIGAALPELPDGDRWCLFGLQELTGEMRRQVLADGADIEGSVPYHCLVAELFLLGSIVAMRLGRERRAGLRAVPAGSMRHPTAPRLLPADRQPFDLDREELFPDWYLGLLLGMAELAADVTKPDGRIPQIGDSDDGRVYRLWRWGSASGAPAGDDPCDRRGLLAVAGRLFDRGDMAAIGEAYAADAELLVADTPTAAVQRVMETRHAAGRRADGGAGSRRVYGDPEGAERRMILYPRGGLAVARAGPLYLIVSMGQVPESSSGGHFHNDLLAFEVQWNGADLVVDGGAYLYTPAPEVRDDFRSTEAHSTISVSGREQRAWPTGAGRLFAVQRDAVVRLGEVARDRMSGEVRYGDVRHVRTLSWTDDSLHIEDAVAAPAPASFVLNLAPGVRVADVEQSAPNRYEVALERARVAARLRLDGVAAPEVAAGYYSVGYGRRQACARLVARVAGEVVTADVTFARVRSEEPHRAAHASRAR